MADEPIQFKVDPDKDFSRAVDKAIKQIDDLTIPFHQMTKAWFKGNRSIFDKGRKGPGKYDDINPKYKKQKASIYGFVYPILRASGHLARSMTDPSHPNSINTIVNKKSLILGTNATTKKGAPYNIYLHRGTSKMPARPYVLIGGEQVANPVINKRKKVWIEMLNDYVFQVTKKQIG